jgi:hypothetical protein
MFFSGRLRAHENITAKKLSSLEFCGEFLLEYGGEAKPQSR